MEIVCLKCQTTQEIPIAKSICNNCENDFITGGWMRLGGEMVLESVSDIPLSTTDESGSISFGLQILCFLIPIIGLIISLLKLIDNKITEARAYGKATLYGVLTGILIGFIAYFVLGVALLNMF